MWQKHGGAGVTRQRRRRTEKASGDGSGVNGDGRLDDAVRESRVVKTECVYARVCDAPFDSGKINDTHGDGGGQ